MPVSPAPSLAVSHLPSSTSFFLSALQPLGYRYIGQKGDDVCLGITEAIFSLCQERSGTTGSAVHIVFSAPSRAAVREFYAAALGAGARSHRSPAVRNEKLGYFSTTVLDVDRNIIEVIFDEKNNMGATVQHSKLLSVSQAILESSTGGHEGSSNSNPVENACKVINTASNVIKSLSSAPKSEESLSKGTKTSSDRGDSTSKAIIGTLLGAAAGAAVVYAAYKTEEDSAKAEAAASNLRYQPQHGLREIAPAPQVIRPNISDTDSQSSISQHMPRRIEAPKYQSPSYSSIAPTDSLQPQASYVPASAVGSRSEYQSQTSASQSCDRQYYAEQSYYEDQSYVSKCKSSTTVSSKSHSSKGRKSSYTAGMSNDERDKYMYVPEFEITKEPSLVSSALTRSSIDEYSCGRDWIQDAETVVPSDSISQVKPRKSHRRSHSAHSRHSSTVKSRKDRKTPMAIEYASEVGSEITIRPRGHDAGNGEIPIRAITQSMIGSDSASMASTSTVKPRKQDMRGGGERPIRAITQSTIDDGDSASMVSTSTFKPRKQEARGGEIPIRAITQSMVDGGDNASMVSTSTVKPLKKEARGGEISIRGITQSMVDDGDNASVVGTSTVKPLKKEARGGEIPIRGITQSMVDGGDNASMVSTSTVKPRKKEARGGEIPIRAITQSMVDRGGDGARAVSEKKVKSRKADSAISVGGDTPIHTITQSMVDGGGKRSVIGYAG